LLFKGFCYFLFFQRTSWSTVFWNVWLGQYFVIVAPCSVPVLQAARREHIARPPAGDSAESRGGQVGESEEGRGSDRWRGENTPQSSARLLGLSPRVQTDRQRVLPPGKVGEVAKVPGKFDGARPNAATSIRRMNNEQHFDDHPKNAYGSAGFAVILLPFVFTPVNLAE